MSKKRQMNTLRDDKAHQKNVIGRKSTKSTVLQSIALVAGLVLLFIYSLDRKSGIFALLIIALLVFGVCTTFCMLIKSLFIRPKNMVEADDGGVYLHYSKHKTVYLPFRSIESVFAMHDSARGVEYSFGFLHLKTKDRRYKIGVIKNVSEAERYICEKIAYKPFG